MAQCVALAASNENQPVDFGRNASIYKSWKLSWNVTVFGRKTSVWEDSTPA